MAFASPTRARARVTTRFSGTGTPVCWRWSGGVFNPTCAGAELEQVREVGERQRGIADLAGELSNLLVRKLEEIIEDSELVENLERRWMNCIAAKVTEKIRVLLEHSNADSRSSEEVAEHHPGGATSYYAYL